MAAFRKILIANRGEIACRIIRAARAPGYETVAVYSDADEGALHVRLADEAAAIGPAPAAESYLHTERILNAARMTGADAVHPGYGFLAENAHFAEACAKAGLTFIGPAAETIALMGDKAVARRHMEAAGVACIPGYHGTEQDDAALAAEAEKIGFPLMVKAAAGGGGKGLRRVARPSELAAAAARARSEALNAFGSDSLILEKAIAPARHVEIQIFADGHGNVIHLGERDCSVQRRHQKVIEEAPAPGMTADLRARMGAAAVAAARAVDYRGAGTVEFLLDTEGNFWFLEMNTRLQVEHPVTETVTGADLVAWQIAVAEGGALPLGQEAVRVEGHAIEARLYAEDAWEGFLPRPGRVEYVSLPGLPGIRIDHALAAGEDVPAFYDPLVAKVIAQGATREEARRRLVQALKATRIVGIETNRSFLVEVLEDSRFVAGGVHTEFLDTEFLPSRRGRPRPQAEDYVLAALALWLGPPGGGPAAWQGLKGWSSSGRSSFDCLFDGPDGPVPVRLEIGGGTYRAEAAGAVFDFDSVECTGDGIICRGGGVRRSAFRHFHGPDCVTVDRGNHAFRLENILLRTAKAAADHGDGVVLAPMHGRVQTIHVQPGGLVAKGRPLLVLEAMKMEHDITAPVAGKVTEILVTDGEQVAAGARLVIVQAEGA